MIIVKREKSGRAKRVLLGIAAVIGVAVTTLVFPLVIQPMLIERRAERELMQMPAFQQIARWEPATYKQMKAAVVAAIGHRESSAQIQGRVRTLVQKLAMQYMKTASDEALIEYMRVNVDEIRQIAAKDADTAFAMLYQNKADVDISKFIDDTTRKRDESALAEIIHTGVTKEAGFQNDDRAKRLLQDVIAGMRADFGADADLPFNGGRRVLDTRAMFANETHHDAAAEFVMAQSAQARMPVDKPRACEMMIVFYDRVLALRSDQAAQVMRLILSKV